MLTQKSIDAFKALMQKYQDAVDDQNILDQIAYEEVLICDYCYSFGRLIMEAYTGFGHPMKCLLCITNRNDGGDECGTCVWTNSSYIHCISSAKTAHETYCNISNACTVPELILAIQARINIMKEVCDELHI